MLYLFLPVTIIVDKYRPIVSERAVARVFCEEITFRRSSITTWGNSTLPFKNYVPLEHRSVRLREIQSKEMKSEEAIVETYSYLAPTFCMRFVHNAVHRKLSSTTSAIWLRHVCLPVSPFILSRRNSDVSAYIYFGRMEKYESVFRRVLPRLTFARKVTWKIILVSFARNKHYIIYRIFLSIIAKYSKRNKNSCT